MNQDATSSRPDSARDAERIWRAGVDAVRSELLVTNAVQRDGTFLSLCGDTFDLANLRRIVVVGAGKAGAGMGRGLERALGTDIVDQKVVGWLNVPADCVAPPPLRKIHLHNSRPAGVNEPTEAGVAGSERILKLVSSLQADDLCLVLISGGGSALLPLPVPGISLADKLAMTRTLSRGGATIQQLNTVRKRLSRIKGGGLVRAATAGHMLALIISDVIDDPLDIIASGPTVPDPGTAADALKVLEQIQQAGDGTATIPTAIWVELQRQATVASPSPTGVISCRNCIIGNNETALNAAMQQARDLGYDVRSLGSRRQGTAREIGVELAELCLQTRREFNGACQSDDSQSGFGHSRSRRVCYIGGGEPVVQLAPTSRPRKGGRNQEVALSALCRLWKDDLSGLTILSGGTDGEDGPTDAAGAICSAEVRRAAEERHLDPFDALSINDSYTFFDAAGGLLKTGPTHTNVMDLQVAVIHREPELDL
jgi:glycerate 2-kinase